MRLECFDEYFFQNCDEQTNANITKHNFGAGGIELIVKVIERYNQPQDESNDNGRGVLESTTGALQCILESCGDKNTNVRTTVMIAKHVGTVKVLEETMARHPKFVKIQQRSEACILAMNGRSR